MKNLKVLIAENDMKVLYAFSKVLENEGCTCFQSSNVLEALMEIPRKKPDAVFLDISRSEGDFDKIFLHIAEKQLPMPLVIISSHITEKLTDLASGVGAMQVIEKPLRLECVRQCLDRIKDKIQNY